MILSRQHRFIFFAVGKTGTTSIESALQRYDEGAPYRFAAPGLFSAKHIPPTIVRSLVDADLWDSCFRFCFVRNPFDWFVSQWFHNFQILRQRRVHRTPMWVRRARGFLTSRQEVLGRRRGELAAKRRFDVEDVRFLDAYLKRHHRVLPTAPSKLQSVYVTNDRGERFVDFVGHFEHLARDFASVLERLSLEVDLPHENRSKREAFQTYFTRESAAEVHRIWARDFEVLGYSEHSDGDAAPRANAHAMAAAR